MVSKHTFAFTVLMIGSLTSQVCVFAQNQNEDSQTANPKRVSFISKAPLAKETPQLAPDNSAPPVAPDATSKTTTTQVQKSPNDPYPAIGALEIACFGHDCASLELSSRLNHLETVVFRKTNSDLTTAERIKKLHLTLLGTADDSITDTHRLVQPPVGASTATHELPSTGETQAQTDANSEADDEFLRSPEMQAEQPQQDLEHYALEAVNEARTDRSLPPLAWDDLGYKVVQTHASDLSDRGVVSHFDRTEANPDKRYTDAGGTDAINESLIAFPDASTKKLNKALIVKMFRQMTKSQDDRESLLAPEATGFAFSFAKDKSRDRYIGVAVVVSKHGIMHPIAKEAAIGEKIDVDGVILPPYKVQKITIAWEAQETSSGRNADEVEEALPYFPPLDFVAYACKSEHDWQKGANVLRTVGIFGAMAGGMVFPPAALAVPLIALAGSGGASDPKPVSEIPVHGGIKVEGSVFTSKVTLTNAGKSGLYYITVWASPGPNGKAVAISRRVVVVKADEENVEGKIKSDKSDKKGQKKK